MKIDFIGFSEKQRNDFVGRLCSEMDKQDAEYINETGKPAGGSNVFFCDYKPRKKKPSTRYLNIKSPQGVETVDELCSADFPHRKAFKAELERLTSEYHLAGMAVYVSTRCDSSWKTK